MNTPVNSELATMLPDGFVMLSELTPLIDCDPRYSSHNNFTGNVVPGYESGQLALTREAANALCDIQRSLVARKLALKVFDAYRPQRAVDHFVSWIELPDVAASKLDYYPDVNKQDLFSAGYLMKKSSHSRGSAVDLTLISISSRQELDMGAPFDFFDSASSHSYADVSSLQRENRKFLRQLMEAHGFNSLDAEWWHYVLAQEPFPDTYFDFIVP